MPCPRELARRAAALLAAASALAVARPLCAQQVRGFFDRAAWDAALLERHEIDVHAIAPAADDSTVYGTASPLLVGAGAFGTATATGPGFAIVGGLADPRGRAATVRPGAPAYRIDLEFSSPITAFGADYLPNTATGTQLFTLSAAGLGTYTLSTGETGWRFFGITSDTPFTSATIVANAPIYYDRPTLGTEGPAAPSIGIQLASGAVYRLPVVTAVPEPATLLLTAAGLVALVGLRASPRRLRRG